MALGGTALSALADITPRPRAATLGTAEPLEPTQVSLLSPRARPTDLTGEPEAIEEPDAEAAAETAAAIEAILPEAVEEPNPIVATSPYAVASSLLPVGRPRGFTDRIAQQRAQRQQQQQRQQAEPVQVATAAAVVTPRNPTQGSVASRATEPNKIRLNDVNLIGVYGTSSNRRALVRLPNGRFVKVRVGDTVDGGRVSAIGADALRYEKRGRSMTLTMPSG
ncbi:Type IV pilus biogenesis [Rhodobacteraceae bacterium THAF1]|nr:Type IV pilus biogenesis [Rhodobacteraceae bacterium THAF1]